MVNDLTHRNAFISNRLILLILFIACKFLIQYHLIDPVYDLQRDEYLHLDQANHLAWGYTSVPPVTSWISWLIKMLGNTVFWIKFFPALFGALTTFVVWKTIEALKGDLFALIFGASCVTFSILFRLNTLYQPNSLDVLCWTLMFYFLIRYLDGYQSKWIFCMALAFALGFLNKYNILFLVMGLVPAILLTEERKIFLNKRLYAGILLAFLLILPNLIWQYQNDFPVLRHMAELARTQLVHVDRMGFLKGQLFFFLGNFLVILFGLYALAIHQSFKKYRLFFWSFLITMGIFIFLKAKDYYAIGIYPVYFAFGAIYISKLLERKSGKVLKPVLIVLSILFFVPVYRIAFPNKTPEYIAAHPAKYKKLGMLRWEDGKEYALPQDFADMLGWKELAEKVDRVYRQMPDQKHTLVLCDNYGQAGAINYYSKAGVRAVSFSADYINWFDLNTKYEHLIRVKYREERAKELLETSPYFRTSVICDSVTSKYAREYGTVIFSFVGAKIDINKRIKAEIEEDKAGRD